jgi:exodeoxyribonuclease VII large subunit
VQPAGVGLLHARFQELKLRLEGEGLFDESRKRELPALPRRLGVATSADGAALHDIVTVLQRRCPLVDVLLAPCLVQGEQAADSIVAALKLLYDAGVDVIILARGGGSIEDLWSFNEEKVVRAVFASPIPLISGVGHETDTTMVDYVADVRAPTPSAAAEIAVPDAAALAAEVAALRQRMDEAAAEHLAAHRASLDALGGGLRQQHPAPRIAQARQQLDDMLRRAGERAAHSLQWQGMRLAALSSQLAALSPQATLQRGYAVVRRAADGSIVLQAGQVGAGDALDIMLHQGSLAAEVTDVADVKTESEPS